MVHVAFCQDFNCHCTLQPLLKLTLSLLVKESSKKSKCSIGARAATAVISTDAADDADNKCLILITA
jgi:hypothetical protein